MQDMAEGMAVEIRPAGGPGDRLSGLIRLLPFPFGGSGGSSDGPDESTRITFDDLAAAFNRYDIGDLVNVSVGILEQADVLWLQPAASRDCNGRKLVGVQTDGVEQRGDVTLGIERGGRNEILTGLTEGQTIVGQ
jgi:hypothetical protein